MLARKTTVGLAVATAAIVAVGGAVGAGLLRSGRGLASGGAAPCAAGSTSACATQLGKAEGEGQALAGQPRLVEFVSGHCPACMRMAPVVAELEQRCRVSTEGSFIQVNVDEPDGEAIASRYQVKLVPTFVGVDAQGVEVMRMTGEQSPQKLAVALGEVRGRACPPAL
jgi:cytochrome c-type biogenesis protein